MKFLASLILLVLCVSVRAQEFVSNEEVVFTSNVQMIATPGEDEIKNWTTEIVISVSKIKVKEQGSREHTYRVVKIIPEVRGDFEINVHYMLPNGARFIAKFYKKTIREIMYIDHLGRYNIIYANKFS